MRIISCDIENFGKFSKKHFDFHNGINTIYAENGWGKSTLAAFICVMFYGFDGESKRDKKDRERIQYAPWQGGAYGGRIIFALDGKEYSCVRSFGAKASEDYVCVREVETNLETEIFGNCPGEVIFGIDRESFINCLYIAQGKNESRATGDISSKLGNTEVITDDISNYQRANESLSDLLNKLSPSRKTGELYKLKNRIYEIKQDVKNKEILLSKLDADLDDLYEIEERIDCLEEEQEALVIAMKREKDEKRDRVQKRRRGFLGYLCILLGLAIIAGGAYLWYWMHKKEIGIACMAFGGLITLYGVFRRKPEKKSSRLEEYANKSIGYNGELKNLYKAKSELESRIKEGKRRLKRLDELDLSLEDLDGEYAKKKEVYEDAKVSQRLLTEAKNNYMARYMKPLKLAFDEYYSIVSGEDSRIISIDVDTKVTRYEHGQQREIYSLSQGYQDMIGFCKRLAYTEVMCWMEVPCLILDDIFVNLDEKRFQGAKDLMDEVGKKYQVIYFTCHKERMI